MTIDEFIVKYSIYDRDLHPANWVSLQPRKFINTGWLRSKPPAEQLTLF